MSNFQLESRELFESGGDVKALLDSCPLLLPDPKLHEEGFYHNAGGDVIRFWFKAASIELTLNSGLGSRSNEAKLAAGYERALPFYEWLCAATPFDWEFCFDYSSANLPERYRPSVKYPHPREPYTDEDDYVYDRPAASSAQ